jgi:hypothetical protein
MNTNRATIYMNEQDKEKIVNLMRALDKRGVDVRGPRGELSMSALFRHLVEVALAEIDTPQ